MGVVVVEALEALEVGCLEPSCGEVRRHRGMTGLPTPTWTTVQRRYLSKYPADHSWSGPCRIMAVFGKRVLDVSATVATCAGGASNFQIHGAPVDSEIQRGPRLSPSIRLVPRTQKWALRT